MPEPVEAKPVTPDETVSSETDSQQYLTPHASRGQAPDDKYERTASVEEPDGGLRAWLRVLGAWLLFVMTWGPALSYGTFQNYYESHLLSDQSASNISWIGSTATTLLIVGGVIAGPLFDRGYLKPLMVLGCFLQVFGFMMLSLSTKYYQIFLSQGICYGIGCGIVYIPGLAFVTTSIKKRRALAVGVTTTGSSIGGIIFPVMFRNLINKVGFAWSCRIIGFVQLACAVMGIGLLLDAPVRKTKPRSLIDWTAFKSIPFDLFLVTGFCQFLAYWIPLFYIPAFATSVLGTSTDMGVYLTVILNAASAFGRVIPAFAVAKFGAAPVVAIATLIATILMFCWIPIHSLAGYVVWCIIFGFVTGVFVSANPIVVTHPSISPSLDILGTRLGMLWFAGGIGALIGGPIAGALARPAVGEFIYAQGFACAIMGLGLVCMSGTYFYIIRWDRKAKVSEKTEVEG